ncbi:protein FAR1-RELATED SEQUENCE 5-like [Populus alba x Populus x berolinensis]|nr:protein FAR1-RELATED SEQUENCE 5-like [Populus alba x Populus x berolinensis]
MPPLRVHPLFRFSMDLDKGVVDTSTCRVEEEETVGDGIAEPDVGMEFESEDAARRFYTEYARRVGFVVRVMQRRRSGIDGRTLARRLGCNKQGFSPNHRTDVGPDKKPRPSARDGCKATILVKMEKSGKWVVTRFERDHNHPLVVTTSGFSSSGDKDKKIEELTQELEHQEQLCATYREKLLSFMNNVVEEAEELASKIQVIVDSVRKVEWEVQKFSRHG